MRVLDAHPAQQSLVFSKESSKRMNCCTKKGYGNKNIEQKRRFSHKMPKNKIDSFYVKDFGEKRNAEMYESGREYKKGFNGQ